MRADHESDTVQPSILPPIATDITSLLAAESYISTVAPKLATPRAEFSFETIATTFCSNAELVIPLSGTDAGPESLVRMWADNASRFTELKLTEKLLPP